MKELALTVKQPWAWAFFQPLIQKRKDVENRGWEMGHRGKLWIHTSKVDFKQASLSMKAVDFAKALDFISEFQEVPDECFFYKCTHDEQVWTYSQGYNAWASGCIIGSVEVIDCRPPSEYPVSDWHMDDQYAIVLDPSKSRLLDKPIPAKGQLGLWDCSKYLNAVAF